MENIINADLIVLDLEDSDKDKTIEYLANILMENGRIHDIKEFTKVVREREAMSSTGIGLGLAIPHGKSESVKVPTVAFAKSKKGIKWQSMDGEPVHLVFLIAVPQDAASNQHLKILAVLSRKLMHEEFRNSLLRAEKKKEVLAILEDLLKIAEIA